MSYATTLRRNALLLLGDTWLGNLRIDLDLGLGEFAELALCERNASCLISSENLSAPVAIDASARLVVLAATVPNAAASFSPEANAVNARSSAALRDSREAEGSPLFLVE